MLSKPNLVNAGGYYAMSNHMILSSTCSPSADRLTNKDEISILFSPQEIGGVHGILKSQISTIPEEETDQEFGGHADQ